MKEASNDAQDFFNQVFAKAGFALRAKATVEEDHVLLDMSGEDSPLLRAEGGELLDALEHLANQCFVRRLASGERFVCDVDGFRATREAELRAMARLAADRVRSSGVPFTFGPMNAAERRVIHLALANDEQLHTESIGEGNERRLKVSLKPTPKQ